MWKCYSNGIDTVGSLVTQGSQVPGKVDGKAASEVILGLGLSGEEEACWVESPPCTKTQMVSISLKSES